MRAVAFALGLAVLVAGCTSTPVDLGQEPGPELPPTQGLFHYANPEGVDDFLEDVTGLVPGLGGAYHHGRFATEPTIGVTSDGTVFMTGSVPNPNCKDCPAVPYANFQRGPNLFRSQDKGQTWQEVFPRLPTQDSQRMRTWDPYVYVDPATDRVFFDDIYPLTCGALAWSDDKGNTWQSNPYACGNPQVNDHQSLVAAQPRKLPLSPLGGGYPNLVYRCVNNLAYIGCAISTDGGRTFLPQIPIEEAAAPCSTLHGHLEADKEGRVFLPLPCGSGGNPSVLITEDDAQTWTVSKISSHSMLGHDVDLAVDDEGGLYAIWPERSHGTDLIFYSHSEDHGRTWSKAVRVSGPQVTGTYFGAIAAGAPGRIAIAYIGTEVEDGYKGKPDGECPAVEGSILGPCTNPEEWQDATWNAYLTLSTNGTDDGAIFQTLAVNDPADPIARGFCGHSRCHGMNDFLDVQVDKEGRPWASFVDVCVAACIEDASAWSDGNIGFAGTLQTGPALRGTAPELPPILPPPATA